MKNNRFCIILGLILALSFAAHGQWVKQSGGLPASWGIGYAIDACSPSVAVISVNAPSPAVYLTKDGGASFLSLNAPEQAWDISIVDSAHIWIVSDTCIYATSDGGASWQMQFSDKSLAAFLNYIRMFDLNNGVAVGDAASGKPMPILQTTDGGTHWTNANASSLIYMVSGDIWRRIDFVNPSVGYVNATAGTGGSLILSKTTNGGSTWSTVLGFNGATVLRFYDQNIGLVSQFGKFYRTTNGGVSWDTIETSMGSIWGSDIEFLRGDPSRVWFTGGVSVADHRMFFSSDTGRTWNEQLIGDGLQGDRDIVFADTIHGWLLCDHGVLYRTTHGNHLYVSVNVDQPEIPREFSLHQNFPNPFNPSTTIRFDLAKNSHVRLEIFNLLGMRVAVLVDELRNAGSYAERFNAANLPSGVYFARLQAGQYSTTKKLLLMW